MDRKARRRASRWHYPSVGQVAAMLVLVRPALPWEREAPTRHAIRIALVLQGMAWKRADWIGHSLVARGRIANGVRQPQGWDTDIDISSWLGSLECVICGKRVIQRAPNQVYCGEKCQTRAKRIKAVGIVFTKCGRCNAPIEDPKPGKLYCSTRCAEGAYNARRWHRQKDERSPATCATCAREFEPARSDQQFCSWACRRAAEFAERRRKRLDARVVADLEAPRSCAHCLKPIPIGSGAGQKYCSNACNNKAYRARKASGALPNGDYHETDDRPADVRPAPTGGAERDRRNQAEAKGGAARAS